MRLSARLFDLVLCAKGVLVLLAYRLFIRSLKASAGLCLLVCAPAAWAWSTNVHTLICAAAYELTSDAGRSLVDRVGKEQWPKGCAWPDEVRFSSHKSTYQYHFINVPKASGRVDVVMGKDCAAHDCVHQAVKRYAAYLVSPATRDDVRLDALRFLGHFVGDLHQPLHVGYAEDLGGNTIRLRMPDGSERNLHSIWDGYLPGLVGLATLMDKDALTSSIDARQKRNWRTISFASAVQESHDLARSVAYRLPDGREVKSNQRLQQSYVQAALPVVRRQIRKSAVRLAHLLHLIGSNRLQPEDLDG